MFGKKEKVQFEKQQTVTASEPDVSDLADAMLDAPGAWFNITSVIFGWDDATQAKLSAIQGALSVRIPERVEYRPPAGRGYAQVRYVPPS